MNHKRRDFDQAAAQWDADAGRVALAGRVADAILREVHPTAEMDVLDFGCGTGLVTLHLQPHVHSITGVDSSAGMLAVLADKAEAAGLTNVHTHLVNFEKGERPPGCYHLIVSSMTMHHVPDTGALFRWWYSLLVPGGRIAVADLDLEDGLFHRDRTGVFHDGFVRDDLIRALGVEGFRDVQTTTATTTTKEIASGVTRTFSIFLLTGTKPTAP